MCCPQGYETTVSDNRICYEKDGPGSVESEPAQNADTDSDFDAGAPVVKGIEGFYCPSTGCLTDNLNNIVNNDTFNNPLTEAQTIPFICYSSGDEKPGAVPLLKCAGGAWLTQDEFDIGGGAQVREQCSLLDGNEVQRCLDCFANNPDLDSGEPQTFVYSSLGCIDTRQNPFITRLFQIGFGLIGGFAIIMIMWGSVQRQSTDPAKIQEGWDKIKAAIASIIMIASAVPLLRYLGINLTGLLPFNIFN